MSFFNRFPYRLAAWMEGRRGVDHLSNSLVIVAIACIVLDMLTGIEIIYAIGLVALVVALLRIFSRNIAARERENAAYERLMTKPRAFFSGGSAMWKNRKTTVYFRCCSCNTLLSVPRGKGTIRVTCPKCHTQQVRKS